ncbi:MAG: shikimate dehydrogenase [Clostridiales bacterium]|nr:shikimate dehydrogenase [Clostridiales bacterium]
MEYGLIGAHLPHSFSKYIHESLTDYTYELTELTPEELPAFLTKRQFKAINVTIPYKEAVIPFLDGIDEKAKRIGAVNTVVNRGGKLYGYNTDHAGMATLIEKNGICLRGKKVLILGSGGTSKTAKAVAEDLGARETYRLSRSGKEGCITYEAAYANHADTAVIINTTPAGMFPHLDGMAADLSRFPRLEAAVDVVYNPLRTAFILAARERGIKAAGGLDMLIAQAASAIEHFTGSRPDENAVNALYKTMRRERENIVLIGMPGSGKSTVGKRLAQLTGREWIDTDALIEKKAAMPIPEIFKTKGERAFRDMETEVIASLAGRMGLVIATGGGAVLREENRNLLRRNGRLYFLDRPLADILPTDDRPLSSDREALTARYRERYPIYTAAADCRIDNSGSAETAADAIMEEFST